MHYTPKCFLLRLTNCQNYHVCKGWLIIDINLAILLTRIPHISKREKIASVAIKHDMINDCE